MQNHTNGKTINQLVYFSVFRHMDSSNTEFVYIVYTIYSDVGEVCLCYLFCVICMCAMEGRQEYSEKGIQLVEYASN